MSLERFESGEMEGSMNGKNSHESGSLKILYLEDNPGDADLLEIELSKRKGHELHVIDNKNDFEQRLSYPYDLFIVDYQLPSYTGKEAIESVLKHGLRTPVIILSGTVGEEEAVNLMHLGAYDFLLKENLSKIHHVIERVIREYRNTLRSEAYYKELKDKNALLDSILNGMNDLMFFKDTSSRYLKVNNAFCEHFEISESNLIGKQDRDLFDEKLIMESESSDQQVIKYAKPIRFITDHKNSKGNRTIFETVKTPIISQNKVIGLVGISRDVTTKLITEEQLRKSQLILSQAESMANVGSFEYNPNLEILECTPNLMRIFGIKSDYNKVSLSRLYKLVFESDRTLFMQQFEEAVHNKTSVSLMHRIMVDQKVIFCKTQIKPDLTQDQINFYGTIVDITHEREQEGSVSEKLEEERKRISRELHDGLGQKLSTVTIYMNNFLSKENKDFVLKAKSINKEASEDLRTISRSLSVKMVEECGLKTAIEDLLEKIPENVRQHKNFDFQENEIHITVATQLYRIAQEAINNMIKYSQATEFTFALKQVSNLLHLQIQDNGVGCAKEKSLKGNGVANIIYRVKRCHGIVDIQCAEGGGFGIEIKVPVK